MIGRNFPFWLDSSYAYLGGVAEQRRIPSNYKIVSTFKRHMSQYYHESTGFGIGKPSRLTFTRRKAYFNHVLHQRCFERVRFLLGN